MNKLIFPCLAAGFALATLSCSASNSANPAGGGGSPSDGGGSSPDATVGTGSTPLPCDVNPIIVTNCQGCHSNPPQNGAPMPLVTWEDFHATTPTDALGPQPITGTYVYQTAQFRIADEQAPMPQPPEPALSAADQATLDTWFTAGAPKTDDAVCSGDASVSAPDAAAPTLTCNSNNAVLKPGTPWTVPSTLPDPPDQYVCYTVPLATIGDAGVTNHVLGITPNIDNHLIVHHVLLFQSDTNDTSVSSTPTPCNPGGSLSWRIVYGWAPGGGPMVTPPNVGFPYTSSTQWIVQVHYNYAHVTAADAGVQQDSTGFSFCTTDQPVANDADVTAFGTMSFNIPPESSLDTTCTWTVPPQFGGIHTFAAFPHMHQLGSAIQTEQTMATGGTLVGMAENTPWNFNDQIWFPISTTLNAGDTITTRCAWLNTTSSSVGFGQDTEDEMCYSFTAYYPKITSGSWTWALPAAGSNCSPSADGGLPTPPGGWATGAGFGADAGGYADASGD